MAPQTSKVGPGTLKLGETGTETDYSAQFTEAWIKWEKEKEEDSSFLSGDTVGGETTYTAKLTGKIAQDLVSSGLVAYSYTHKGESVSFIYTPTTAREATLTGTVIIDPIDIGGEVSKRAVSDIEWDCVGEPTLSFTTHDAI